MIQEIFACPFFWGDLDDNEAEDILANEPLGSYILRKSWNQNYLLRVSFKESNIRHGHICKLNTSDQVDGKHYVKLEDILKDKNQSSFCDVKKYLKFPVIRKSPFSLQKLTRACIADSTRLQEDTKLKLPKKLQEFLKEYQFPRSLSKEDSMPNFKCDDFLPDLPEDKPLFHSTEIEINMFIQSVEERIQANSSRLAVLISRINELDLNLTKLSNALDDDLNKGIIF